MVCSCSSTWILSIASSDFCTLTPAQYTAELLRAEFRARYIMLTPYDGRKNPGWGISQEDFDNDESGQIQVGYELLITSEFLNRQVSFYQRANLLQEYESPSEERLNITPQQFQLWSKSTQFLRERAWEVLYPYISDDAKRTDLAPIVASNYDYQQLEKEYHQEIYPAYNPLPYLNPDFY